MITNFKLFENINEGDPEEGYYVVVKLTKPKYIGDVINISENNIGKIQNKYISPDPRVISYYIVYTTSARFGLWVDRDEIVGFSKNKEDLQHILQGNKYNL